MQREAERLAVGGWVRNRPDGTVEAVLTGEGEAVAELIGWARRGPAGAAVEHVLNELGEKGNEFDSFSIRRD